ncbi:MAG: 2-phosphosulfolactate phosphatase [Candidatus Muiribacteriota bacterium]
MLSVYKGEKESVNARGNVVVVDIICATTVICYFMAKGAEKVIPVENMEEALFFKKKFPHFLLAGDFAGEYSSNFNVDIFNKESFDSFLENIQGKTVIYISANGTKRIIESKKAKKHIIASFINFQAVADYVLENVTDFTILLAMSRKFASEEDLVFAEALNEYLTQKKVDFNKKFLKVTNSEVVVKGQLIFGAPYLIELAVQKNLTNIIPVSYYDNNIENLALKPLSEV